MNEWGNNPQTYQTVASVVTAASIVALFFTTLFTWWSLRETQIQRKAIERELAARMRPWMGLFDFEFESSSRDQLDSVDAIKFLLKNFGVLPAQNVVVSLRLYPFKRGDGEPDNSIRWEDNSGAKAILPGEDGNYRLPLTKYPQFAAWRDARRDIQIDGLLSYELDHAKFSTEFKAGLLFGSGRKMNEDVKLSWRNCSAT